MSKKIIALGVFGILIIVVLIFVIKYTLVGNYPSQFVGPVSSNEPLPEALISDLDQYVLKLMKQFDVPGAAMVLVHGDEVVHIRGFGVRDLETEQLVTHQTLFGIGSSTKPMTAIMVASLVDEGVIHWDTLLTEVLPSFALSNPEITEKITFMHTLCMCTGVPRKVEDISVRYSELTAEDMIESLAKIPLKGKFEQQYAYSERMFSAGGYLAAMAAGGDYGSLAQAYSREMQKRVLDPTGMTFSTLSIERVVSNGDFATPHYSSLMDYEAIPLEIEGIFTPIAPTGAMWSNAEDLGKLLVMLLKDGVSVDGQRVVSKENLAYLWEPRTQIDEIFTYGLGWNIEDFHGLTVIDHPGGTVGFASELVVIPELDVGFAMLINRLDLVHPLGRMTRYRLLEMLAGSEQNYDRETRKTAKELERQILLLSLITRKTVNPEKIAPYLGRYHNQVLGEAQLVLREDNTLWIDFGEYDSSIRPLILEQNHYIFFDSVFIGKTIELSVGSDGNTRMQWLGDEGTYLFTRE